MIFIDELDGLCRKRLSTEEEYSRRIKTELLRQIENATRCDIFLLCATNCPWELDSAFLRRFQKRVYVPLPDRLEFEVFCKTLRLGFTVHTVSLYKQLPCGVIQQRVTTARGVHPRGNDARCVMKF